MKNGATFKRDQVVFNTEAVSLVQMLIESGLESSIGGSSSKTASVKFMLTIQDEKDLRKLGYSQIQIDNIKPQEAADIIKSATKAD